MTPWPQAIATFYLSGGVLGLLLLNNLPTQTTDVASPGIVAVSAIGLIAGVVLTVVRIVVYARAIRRPDVARRRGPLSEPVDPGRAVAWAVVGVFGAVLVVLARRMVTNRPVDLTIFTVGVVLVGLAWWFLWRAPLRPVSSFQDDRNDVTG